MRRARLSFAEKADLWARWKRGESLSDIARALDRVPGSVFHVVEARGGVAPVTRRRSRWTVCSREREEISRALARGLSFRAIAGHLGRAPSTISREVVRHGGRARYRAAEADARAWRAARRPKPCRLACHPRLCRLVAEKLALAGVDESLQGRPLGGRTCAVAAPSRGVYRRCRTEIRFALH